MRRYAHVVCSKRFNIVGIHTKHITGMSKQKGQRGPKPRRWRKYMKNYI